MKLVACIREHKDEALKFALARGVAAPDIESIDFTVGNGTVERAKARGLPLLEFEGTIVDIYINKWDEDNATFTLRMEDDGEREFNMPEDHKLFQLGGTAIVRQVEFPPNSEGGITVRSTFEVWLL